MCRQYTDSGSVNAFAQHLPRLRELGVDILWMMPVHPISKKGRKGILGSYYAVADDRKNSFHVDTLFVIDCQ